MALFDIFKKYYVVQVRCYNCGFSQECRIPKGNTIDSWLAQSQALCSNCGNPTLRRIEKVEAPPEVQKPLKERFYSQPQRNQPMTPNKKLIQGGKWTPEQQKQIKQQVKYPVKEPVVPQEQNENDDLNLFKWNPPKKKEKSFWVGEEEQEPTE